MSRTLAAPMVAMLAQASRTLARCLRIDLSDGTSIGITDHDRVLWIDLGDGLLDYRPETGILPSAITLTTGFEADTFEVSGPLSATITRPAVVGGRFDMADVLLFDTNWAAPDDGVLPIMAGHIAEARAPSGRFLFEIRSVADRFNQTIGRVSSPYCDADYGDARCGAVVPTEAVTVASVTDDTEFTVTFAGTVPVDGWYAYGTAAFTAGVLAGVRPAQVFAFANATRTVTLDTPLPALPGVGDTLTLARGCPKTRTACVERENAINFRGFPDLPGTDKALRYPVPGQP